MDLERDLFEEMFKDGIVIQYLKDVEIAKDFYRALCNTKWYTKEWFPAPEDERIISKLKGEEKPYWSCSWRVAGGYIAEIRNHYYNTTDDYIDFYCSGNEGIVTGLVIECFDRMGWYHTHYE